MKRLVVVVIFLVAGTASAQQQSPTPPMQACQSMLMETTVRQIEVRTELFTLIAELERLRKENADLKMQIASQPK